MQHPIISVFTTVCLVSALSSAHAAGFQLNHHEPTTAGEWGFIVDHPWYTSTRTFAAGLTLDYAHDPLVYGTRTSNSSDFNDERSIIESQLYGHVDVGVSFVDRLTLNASLPILLADSGETIAGIGPVSGMAVNDPRIGVMARIFGHSDRDPISLHVGANLWIPIQSSKPTVGDDEVRVMPKLVVGGYGGHLLWSVTGAFYYRPASSVGDEPRLPGNASGSEVQIGAALAYADWQRRFTIGPEALYSTIVKRSDAFNQNYSGLEILLGANYNIARTVQVGLAGGIGLLQQPGIPDARGLLRIAYAPLPEDKPKDGDGDGITDKTDQCPSAPEDSDGFQDSDGCPDTDNDSDGAADANDKCPNEAGPAENGGCPDSDADGDGLVDRLDQCPTAAEDKDGFQDEDGCADLDNDNDGTPDANDRCVNEPGPTTNGGCREPDSDGDGIVDRLDNCPTVAGTSENHGCIAVQLARIAEGRIEISQAVFFATGKDTIGKQSYALLDNVAAILQAHPELDVRIEGHSDNVGKETTNLNLSTRRATSVMKYLVKKGIAQDRLTAEGYGSSQPVESNATPEGRAKNRRVVFSTSVRAEAGAR